MSLKTLRESKAWKAINDVSLLRWLIGGIVSLISWANAYMRNLPFGLVVIYVAGSGLLVTLLLDWAVTLYKRHANAASASQPQKRTETEILANIAFGSMLEESELFLRTYRQMDQHERDRVKLPLSPSSYPDFGHAWEYEHACMWSLKQRLDWLVIVAELAWKQMGWADQPMLFHDSKNKSIVMANLIASLEDFKIRLENKISLIEGGEK